MVSWTRARKVGHFHLFWSMEAWWWCCTQQHPTVEQHYRWEGHVPFHVFQRYTMMCPLFWRTPADTRLHAAMRVVKWICITTSQLLTFYVPPWIFCFWDVNILCLIVHYYIKCVCCYVHTATTAGFNFELISWHSPQIPSSYRVL